MKFRNEEQYIKTHPPNLHPNQIIHLPVAHHSQHHYIDIIPEGRRRKCAVCTDRNNTFRKSRISTWCSTCVVGLCVGDCFRKFHVGQEEWATVLTATLKGSTVPYGCLWHLNTQCAKNMFYQFKLCTCNWLDH